MTATIFDVLTLSDEARCIVTGMSPTTRLHLIDAVEHFASVSNRPIGEITERLICGFGDVLAGHGNKRLLDLIVDVMMDDDVADHNLLN